MVIYSPSQGDLVWLDFSPQAGHEQAGRRPALIISTKFFFQCTGLVIACPITSKDKGFPLHVKIPSKKKIQGFVMCEQVKSLDPDARNIEFSDSLGGKDVLIIKSYLETFFE